MATSTRLFITTILVATPLTSGAGLSYGLMTSSVVDENYYDTFDRVCDYMMKTSCLSLLVVATTDVNNS